MKKQLSVFILAILSLSLTACIDQYSPRDRTLELTTGVVQVFTAHSDTNSTKLNWYLDGAEVATEKAQYTYTAPQTIGTHKLQVIEYVKVFWGTTYTKGDTITWTITVVEPVTPICYLDEDGDGYGDPTKQIQSDTPPENCVDNSDDCNDSNASINPEAHEICNSIDDDCDGQVDEGVQIAYYKDSDSDGYGVTAVAGYACTVPSGHSSKNNDCNDNNSNINPNAAELCDGLDNDCDNSVDENLTQSCPDGQAGSITCVGGQLVNTCEGPCVPTGDEICDGFDNDCDGSVDEDIAAVNTTCGVGECVRTGQQTCVGGKLVDSCKPGTAGVEVCDGKDNDCDGTVDDVAPISSTCGVGECARTGQKTCVNGALVDSCAPGASTAEVCDGKDNDCNGTVDNGIAAVATTCGVGQCASTGQKTCVSGALVDSCKPGASTPEVCDGKDNDCDGTVDDGIAPVSSTCGVGECVRTGQKTCVSGALVDSCVQGTPAAEVCDGKDNDCNGTVDNGIAAVATTCGVGECVRTGQKTCVSGAMVDSCKPGTSTPEVCDGKDNDCNGTVDNVAPVSSTCGVGECVRTGEKTCVSGVLVDSCAPGASTAEVCDGKDNDCNGTVDNDIAAVATTCGVGECVRTGEKTCVSGAMVDSCKPGASTPEVCDGLDNDCNGTVDNNIPTVSTACGLGECIRSGQKSCIGGQMVTSCVPGTPTAEVCDGKDNDCNGSVDNGIATSITCPNGGTGLETCVDGVLVNDCLVCSLEPPQNVNASDKEGGLTAVEITWDPVLPATCVDHYNVYRADSENGSYELIDSTQETSYTFEELYDVLLWENIDTIGFLPSLFNKTSKEQFAADLLAYKNGYMPWAATFKAVNYFKVAACDADDECSDLSNANAGQAEFVHEADHSDIAEVMINCFGYPLMMAINDVPMDSATAPLGWDGHTENGDFGGTMVGGIVVGASITVNFNYNNYSTGPSASRQAIINGYIGGVQNLGDALAGIIKVSGTLTVSTGEYASTMFVNIVMGGEAELYTVDVTYKGETYQFDLPIY